MKIPILSVQFINVVSHGAQISSANGTSPADAGRPGSTPFEIELDEGSGIFRLTKKNGSKVVTRYVPMSNVASFEPIVVEEKKEEPVKAVKK